MAALKVKDVTDIISKALHADLSTEKKEVLMAVDLAQKDMAEIRDWPKLRMKKTFSMTGTDTALPTNLIGVTGVKSATAVYFKCEEEDILSVDDRPHWCYASQTGDSPSSAPYFNIYDVTGAAATASATVFYWAYPDTISGDNDDLLVPGPRAIAMLSIVILLGLAEHKTAEAEPFRQEYNSALAELMQRYPLNARAKFPRGRHGLPLAQGDRG